MKLGFTITTAELPESQEYGVLPAGEYSVKVKSCEPKATKKGDGKYLKLAYEVTGPTHIGRIIFSNLNIQNPNPKAEEIGRRELGDLLRAINLQSLEDTDQLIGGNCMVKISVSPATEFYDEGNDVKRVFASKNKSIVKAKKPAPAPVADPEEIMESEPAPKKKAPWS